MNEKQRIKKCIGKQVIGIGKVYRCGSYIKNDQKLCDNCLLGKFKLDARYDSEDTWSMAALYLEEQVIRALREASGL